MNLQPLLIPNATIQKYKRYLPTAFDESLTLLEKVNKIIEFLNTVINVTNNNTLEFDKLEKETNEKIQNLVNQFTDLRDWLEGEGLEENTSNVLDEWFQNGKLETIINENVFNMKADKSEVDALSSQLAQLTYNVQSFGIVPESEDNTQAFNDMVNSIPDGSRVLFPKGTYKGNFISNKSLDIDFQGSTIIPVTNNLPVVRFEGKAELTKFVIGNPVYGDFAFEVNDVIGLAIDDIGYLVDDSLHPSTSATDKNTEMVKIRAISGNTLTVYDKIRSNQNTGNVRFVKINPIKKPSIRNAVFNIPNTHNSTICGFVMCENTTAENIEVYNSTGAGLENSLCYGLQIENVKFVKPYKTGGGEGYGVTIAKSKHGVIKNIHGTKTRHVVDLDSSYHMEIDGVEEDYSISSSVVLSHNGYGGKITARNINVTLDRLANYGVQLTNQGLSDVDKQCFKDITIENVEVTVPNHLSGDLINAVRILNHYADVVIDNVKLTVKSDTEDIPLNTMVVFLRGNQKGNALVSNIKANKVEYSIWMDRLNNNYVGSHNAKLVGVEGELVRNAIWLRGIKKAHIDNINIQRTGGHGGGLMRFEPHMGVDCDEITVGNDIHIPDRLISDNNITVVSLSTIPPVNGFRGKFPLTHAFADTNLSLSEGYTIPSNIIFKSTGYLELLSITGVDVVLNTTTPISPPLWQGQELFIAINPPYYQGGRGNVIIKPGTTTVFDNGVDIVLEKGKLYRLVGHKGKWVVS